MTKEEEKKQASKQLSLLKKKVEEALKARTDFLDKHMHLFAKFQIGEEVINRKTGERTEVTEHYRYHRDSPQYDTSLYCDCRFKNGDNTSCYGGGSPYISVRHYNALKERNPDFLYLWR